MLPPFMREALVGASPLIVGGVVVLFSLWAIAVVMLPLFVWSGRDAAKRAAREAAQARDELRRIRQALERAYPPPRSGP